jgi:hypothetical protein
MAIALLCIVGLVAWQMHMNSSRISNASESTPNVATAHPAPNPHTVSTDAQAKHSVLIQQPKAAPRVDMGTVDAHGVTVTAACSTCHSNRKPNRENKVAADLDEFHQGMTLTHGKIACLACHKSNDYDSLQLADGTKIEFQDVMTLCSQCHGTQRRDFDHGAHGGMTGHWDLSRGPRVRNNCVDCHHPHQPQFPKMLPTFKPRDRFLSPSTDAPHAP